MANLTIELEKSKGDWNQAILTMSDSNSDTLRETVKTFVTRSITGGLQVEVHNVLAVDLTVKPKEILSIHIPKEMIQDILNS